MQSGSSCMYIHGTITDDHIANELPRREILLFARPLLKLAVQNFNLLRSPFEFARVVVPPEVTGGTTEIRNSANSKFKTLKFET